MKILITGAAGFIGRSLYFYLEKMGINVIGIDLLPREKINFKYYFEADITKSNLDKILDGVEVIIHLAAKVDNLKSEKAKDLNEYRKINVIGTRKLAMAALKKGVKKFIFLSTSKVNGEQTPEGVALKETDKPRPMTPYAISKYEAELELIDILKNTNLNYVIIRPPLVYGPGVKANFELLIRLIKAGIPLPFGSVKNNRRSYIAIDNLLSFIVECINDNRADNNIFFVSDDRDLSTKELIEKISLALGKRPKLVSIPVDLLWKAAKINKQEEKLSKLVGSFSLDISKAKQILGWKPVISFEEGIKKALF